MSFRKYLNYKNSGNELLAEIPDHWELVRLSSVCQFQSGKAHEPFIDDDGRYICVNSRFVSTEGASRKFCSQNLMPAKLHDILMVMSDLPNGRALAKAFYVDDDAPYAVNQRVCALTPLHVNPRFLFYYLNRNVLFLRHDDGVNQTHLSNSVFTKLPTLVPTAAEQSIIVRFLDRETSKIDELVTEQQRLIVLLKEKRQAVISHAVTKGLNPDVPRKPSGIKWLGDMPQHWEVKRLGYMCSKIGSGKTPTGGAETYLDCGVLFIRSQNVYDEGLRLDDVVYISDEMDMEMGCSRVTPGDILLNITGASLGRTCLVPYKFERANVNQHVCILRPNSLASRQFVAMCLKSSRMKSQFDAVQNGAAREGLNFSQISKLALCLPPASEQVEIVSFLNEETQRLDELVHQAGLAIDLLRERRSALVSAAVTGKIDVRELVNTEGT